MDLRIVIILGPTLIVVGGICCDIYAVGFTLPNSEDYDEYIFKLVDSENYNEYGDYPEELKGELPKECEEQPNLLDPRFDTIVFYEEFSEKLEDLLGPSYKWDDSLLKVLNEMFGMNATKIRI
jgi:hypothetical protein